jgi:hypothetical protein
MKKIALVLVILILLPCLACISIAAAITMNYDAKTIENLRNSTQMAENSSFSMGRDPVSRYEINYSVALEPYSHIELQDGYRLCGVYVVDGLGSYSIPFALPINETFTLEFQDEIPPGEEIPPPSPRQGTGRYIPLIDTDDNGPAYAVLPAGADREFMNYFSGDDTPESYMEASVLVRELPALDAGWHARIGWPISKVITYNQTPLVTMNSTHAEVRLMAEMGYCGSTTIREHTDIYPRPSVSPVTEITEISRIKGGKTKMSQICF